MSVSKAMPLVSIELSAKAEWGIMRWNPGLFSNHLWELKTRITLKRFIFFLFESQNYTEGEIKREILYLLVYSPDATTVSAGPGQC